MATISIETVKELRGRTGGVSIMQCSKALEETNGDIDKAEIILRKRAGAVADKKSGRDLGAGAVASYIHDGTIGALVLLSCETDFVGRNPDFINLAHEIAMQVAATNPTYRTTEEVPAEARDTAMSVFKEEVKDKPDDMKEKILAGKLASYFKDQVLMEQSYIKDDSKTIHNLITEATQKFGERIEVTNYVRYSARD